MRLPPLGVRGLGDRLDERTGLRLVLGEGDVGLSDDADEPAVLEDGQSSNLVVGHEFERVFEILVGLDTDEVTRADVVSRFAASAATLVVMSRSVMTPTSCSSSVIGSEPMCSFRISLAASTTDAEAPID
jgi:hypothetical protein